MLPADSVHPSTVRFTKYTSFGNTFIVVDESTAPLADDTARATFARWALNADFGLGGTDNVLYLQRLPEGGNDSTADFTFRIFEHDGSETLSCGNGLLSTAALLHRGYDGHEWSVLTELPTGNPQLVRLGVGRDAGTTWINVGWPRAVPEDLFNRTGSPTLSRIDIVDDLVVPLPSDASWAKGLPATVSLSGFLVFTGEPHLALISGHGLPKELEDRLFIALDRTDGAGAIGRPDSPQMREAIELVDHLGRYVNTHYRALFPQGVHLNFAAIRDTAGLIEYRTYERAIDTETLACGSGVVALAYIAKDLDLISGTETTFWPHRCRWYQPDASLAVAETTDGWVLTGSPRLVCDGIAPLPPMPVNQGAAS